MTGKLSIIPHNPNAEFGMNRYSYYRAQVGDLTFMLAISPNVKSISAIRYDAKVKDFEVDLVWEINGEERIETEMLELVYSARKWFGNGPIVEALRSVDRWEIDDEAESVDNGTPEF